MVFTQWGELTHFKKYFLSIFWSGVQPWINCWKSQLRVAHCLWTSCQCGERPYLLEVCCCWLCEFFDSCRTNSNWGKTLWLGLFSCTLGYTPAKERSDWEWHSQAIPGWMCTLKCELFSLEHIMSCNCSRVAANLGAFPPRLARVYQVCPKFLEFGKWALVVTAPYSIVSWCSPSVEGLSFNSFLRNMMEAFGLFSHCWERCRKRWCWEVWRAVFCFSVIWLPSLSSQCLV